MSRGPESNEGNQIGLSQIELNAFPEAEGFIFPQTPYDPKKSGPENPENREGFSQISSDSEALLSADPSKAPDNTWAPSDLPFLERGRELTLPFPRGISERSKGWRLASPDSEPSSPAESRRSTESTHCYRMFHNGQYTIAPVSSRKLGSGGQGVVRIAGILSSEESNEEEEEEEKNNDLVVGWAAVKTVSPNKQERALQESENHRVLTNDGKGSLRTGLLAWIAQININKDGNGIVMPLCRMTLSEFNEQWLSAVDDHITRHCVMHSVLRSILRALRTLQEKGAAHNDIKDENCMLRESGGMFGWVLTDFGTVCATANPGNVLPAFAPDAMAGSPCYIAPEVVHGEPPAFHSDIFSAGETLRRLIGAAFTIPFNDNTVTTLFDTVMAYEAAREESPFLSGYSYQSEIMTDTCSAPTFDEHYERLTAWMCSILPEKRPDLLTLEQVAKEMLRHLPDNHDAIAQAFYCKSCKPSLVVDAGPIIDDDIDEGLAGDCVARVNSTYTEDSDACLTDIEEENVMPGHHFRR